MNTKLLFLGVAVVAVAASVSPLVISTNNAEAEAPRNAQVLELAQLEPQKAQPVKKQKRNKVTTRGQDLSSAQKKLAELSAETDIKNQKKYTKAMKRLKKRIAKLETMSDADWEQERKEKAEKRAKKKAAKEAAQN